MGLGLNEDEAKVKCYMADTGLLSALTFADRKTTPASLYKDVLFGKLAFNEGMFVENLVAQQLRASGIGCFSIPAVTMKTSMVRWRLIF